jgi:sarcosine/dimethylglycine N-methyltransferase
MSTYSKTVKTAQTYYNSSAADNFYFHIWGGEDIHVGVYQREDEPIGDASQRTVETMVRMLPPLGAESRVIDFGAGYGGAARYLAGRFGCHVTAVNLSETQNERNREMNRAQGLDHLIDVVDASFDNVTCDDRSFDVVWSEDAILHSDNRRKVLEEAWRVLKPGGHLIFTDPMQSEDCPPGVLQPVYDRIQLDSLASFSGYRATAKAICFTEKEIIDLSEQLTRHYARVQQELKRRYDECVELSGNDYVDRMIAGLQHWIDGGTKGYLAWGILHFVK